MFDDKEKEERNPEEECPIMVDLTINLKFPKTGQLLKERITINTDEGVFGNEEVMAKMIINEMVNGEERTAIAEGDMPLQTWIGRLLAVFRETAIHNKNNPDSETEIIPSEEQIDYDNYIFKRK